jgi:hypothetical protein
MESGGFTHIIDIHKFVIPLNNENWTECGQLDAL